MIALLYLLALSLQLRSQHQDQNINKAVRNPTFCNYLKLFHFPLTRNKETRHQLDTFLLSIIVVLAEPRMVLIKNKKKYKVKFLETEIRPLKSGQKAKTVFLYMFHSFTPIGSIVIKNLFCEELICKI